MRLGPLHRTGIVFTAGVARLFHHPPHGGGLQPGSCSSLGGVKRRRRKVEEEREQCICSHREREGKWKMWSTGSFPALL